MLRKQPEKMNATEHRDFVLEAAEVIRDLVPEEHWAETWFHHVVRQYTGFAETASQTALDFVENQVLMTANPLQGLSDLEQAIEDGFGQAVVEHYIENLSMSIEDAHLFEEDLATVFDCPDFITEGVFFGEDSDVHWNNERHGPVRWSFKDHLRTVTDDHFDLVEEVHHYLFRIFDTVLDTHEVFDLDSDAVFDRLFETEDNLAELVINCVDEVLEVMA